MANIKSFPNNQDTYIGAEDVMKWHHGRTSGVFKSANYALVSALSTPGMAVTVADGTGWISNGNGDGIVWWNDNYSSAGSLLQVSIDSADGVLNRIDRIIVEWKTTNYVDYPEIKVLKGTAASTAVAPSLTNNSTVRQISLAQVSIPAGTTAITASMITDERPNSAVCGWVTEAITIDNVPSHASTHASNGSDPVSPASIGAAALGSDGKVLSGQASAYINSTGSSITIAASDCGKMLLCNNEADIVLTIPSGTTIPVQSEIEVCRWSAASVKITAASGVSIYGANITGGLAASVVISDQFGCCGLKKVDNDGWLVTGGVEDDDDEPGGG